MAKERFVRTVKTKILKPKPTKSKSRLMKERRRKLAKKRFLPENTGDNKFPMTKSCRQVLNKWVRKHPDVAKAKKFTRVRKAAIKQLDKELISKKGELC